MQINYSQISGTINKFLLSEILLGVELGKLSSLAFCGIAQSFYVRDWYILGTGIIGVVSNQVVNLYIKALAPCSTDTKQTE